MVLNKVFIRKKLDISVGNPYFDITTGGDPSRDDSLVASTWRPKEEQYVVTRHTKG